MAKRKVKGGSPNCIDCGSSANLIVNARWTIASGEQRLNYLCRNCKRLRQAAYYKTAAGGANVRRINKRAAAKHQIETRARRAVNIAVKKGKLIPQPCEVCGAKAQAHHPDYGSPLVVQWLCHGHHADEHRREMAQNV